MVCSGYAGAADAIPGEQWCDRTVVSIVLAGNDVTRDHVIQRELPQRVGSPCSLDNIIDGVQNILDLGLFQSVRAELHLDENALVLRYIVKEKIFFLPIPRFSRTSDGELRLGAQLRWDNFMGRLHQLKLTGEKRQENDGRGRTGYVHSMDYVVPRFFQSSYGLSVSLASERRNVELAENAVVFGEALRRSQRGEWRLARWSNDNNGIKGLSYFTGFGVEHREYEIRSGNTGPFRDGKNVNLIAGFDIKQIHQDTYRRRGSHYSAYLSMADKLLGGDFRYVRTDVQARWYIPLDRPETNLNVQLRVGLSSAAPFGERTYSIGGGDMLRGMQGDTATGNFLTLANLEYLSGFFAYPAWRWLIFADIGNVFNRGEVNLLDQHIRLGSGLRWKLARLTNTDIRLDLAWDPRRSKITPYLSTSLTF